MISKIKSILMTLAVASSAVLPVGLAVGVGAQVDIEGGLCKGANLSASGTCDEGTIEDSASTVDSLLTSVINIFSLVVGVISVIMIIIGGLKYITSGGDSGNVSGAKNTILYAVIGLVVVALAQIIVRFVLAKVGEATGS